MLKLTIIKNLSTKTAVHNRAVTSGGGAKGALPPPSKSACPPVGAQNFTSNFTVY